MAVSRRLRFEVLKRDRHRCFYCGQRAPDVPLTVDHVIPTALGGTDDPSNLVAACADCNGGKSSVHPNSEVVADVDRDALRWAAALRLAAEQLAAERDAERLFADAFHRHWAEWGDRDGDPMPMPANWRQSIAQLRSAGMSADDAIECVEITMAATGVRNVNLFRYFCGCAYRRINATQDRARDLLGGA